MSDGTWHPTACILCECNCGIEVRLGGDDGRRFERIRGDKAHPASHGLHVREGAAARPLPERPPPPDVAAAPPAPTAPSRRSTGTPRSPRWRPASPRCATPTAASRSSTTGAAGRGTTSAAPTPPAPGPPSGSRFRSNALAQEKTGEFWVNGQMLGTHVRGDFEHAEVGALRRQEPVAVPRPRRAPAPRSRRSPAIPARSIIVIDPRRTETADLADFHLAGPARHRRVVPRRAGRGAGAGGPARPTRGWPTHADRRRRGRARTSAKVDVARYCAIAGVDEDLVRRGRPAHRRRRAAWPCSRTSACRCRCTRRCRATSRSSLWLLTGNFGMPGAPVRADQPREPRRRRPARAAARRRTSPVAGARIISGLVPCNVIAEEILTDHPDRYRAMLVESGNPAHSLADSQRMREALGVARAASS